MNTNLTKQAIDEFLSKTQTLTEISKKYKIDYNTLVSEIRSRGYIFKKGYSSSTTLSLKSAIDEYLNSDKPSLTKISKKYNISRNTLSNSVKELGYSVENYQNKSEFNEHVFDEIDTEEKAYWLGFIFADGYISSNSNNFEISLKEDDKPHLEKFNSFIEGSTNKVKVGEANCGNAICKRCRWGSRNKHLKETLVSYGCIPQKSLILQFPSSAIFKSPNLIRHFIRGYWDGDGCLTYANKEHTRPEVLVLGTEDFLTEMKDYLPLKFDYKLGYNNGSTQTRVLSLFGKNGFELAKYLYSNCTVYLDRKYEKYLEYCRLYEESYRELEGKNGESCDGNTVLNSEITKGSESV